MNDPDSTRQVAIQDIPIDSDERLWIRVNVDELYAEGMTHLRVTAVTEPDAIILIEGWRVKPDALPEPHFLLTEVQ